MSQNTDKAAAIEAYTEKREARIDRLRARAAKKAGEGDAFLARSRRLGNMIPFGQPILVGHHSERRARKDVQRIRDWASKGLRLRDQAEALESRAASAESNRAIFTDDPEALDKLRAKLAKINGNREEAKRINKACRAKEPRKALAALGYTESQIDALLTPDFCNRIGIPDYKLTNWGAEARRLAKRIAELEAKEAAPAPEAESFGEVEIREQDNRVQIIFPGKPSAEIRAELKAAGFRWAPSVGAWQRHASEAAWWHARAIVKKIAANA